MNDPLRALARQVEDDPFFLASLLHPYAQSEGLDDARLAEALNCRAEDLVMIRLCRAPRPDAQGFREDITRVAERFGADRQKLSEAVRRGQAIRQTQTLRPTRTGTPATEGTLLAARDHEPPEPHNDG